MYTCSLQCQTLASPIAGVQNKKLLLVLIVFYQKAQTVDDEGRGGFKEISWLAMYRKSDDCQLFQPITPKTKPHCSKGLLFRKYTPTQEGCFTLCMLLMGGIRVRL